MIHFIPFPEEARRTPTQIRHERVKSQEQMTPIVFIYAIGLILFCVTGFISSLF